MRLNTPLSKALLIYRDKDFTTKLPMNVPQAYLHIIDYLGQAAKLVPRTRLDVKVAITRLCGEKEKERFRQMYLNVTLCMANLGC